MTDVLGLMVGIWIILGIMALALDIFNAVDSGDAPSIIKMIIEND